MVAHSETPGKILLPVLQKNATSTLLLRLRPQPQCRSRQILPCTNILGISADFPRPGKPFECLAKTILTIIMECEKCGNKAPRVITNLFCLPWGLCPLRMFTEHTSQHFHSKPATSSGLDGPVIEKQNSYRVHGLSSLNLRKFMKGLGGPIMFGRNDQGTDGELLYLKM